MSIFHEHNHTKLKYCPNVINESGHKLGSLWWDIGDSLIRYRITKSSKPLWKIKKITFTKAFGKSWKPLLNQNNLSPCLTFSLLHCRHVTNLMHQDNTYQSSELVCDHLSLSCFLYFWLILPAYISYQLSCQEAALSWPQNLMPCTTWNGLMTTHINK